MLSTLLRNSWNLWQLEWRLNRQKLFTQNVDEICLKNKFSSDYSPPHCLHNCIDIDTHAFNFIKFPVAEKRVKIFSFTEASLLLLKFHKVIKSWYGYAGFNCFITLRASSRQNRNNVKRPVCVSKWNLVYGFKYSTESLCWVMKWKPLQLWAQPQLTELDTEHENVTVNTFLKREVVVSLSSRLARKKLRHMRKPASRRRPGFIYEVILLSLAKI